MNLRHFEILRAVMRTGSVTEAARLMGVSQPAISKMLRETEQRLGARLFERHGGRLVTRPEAKPLWEAVEKLFFDIEQIRLLSEELQEPTTMRLKIGAIPTATMTALPPAITKFRKRFPQVRVEIFALPTRQIVDDVATGALDIGFAYSVTDHPAIDAIDVMDTEIICVMRPDHPLARKATIAPRDLEGHPIISFHLGESISLTINEGFRAAGARCAPSMLVSHSFTACALAEQGAGIAFVTPLLISSGVFRNLVTRPFRPKLHLRPRILHARHRRVSPEVRAMTDEIYAVVERQIQSAVTGIPARGRRPVRQAAS